MIALKVRKWMTALATACALAGCGGGGGGGGESAQTASSSPTSPGTTTPPSTSGIEGTGRNRVASIGAITGFGSVIVNGVRYATDTATISVNGRSVSQSELKLGQVVTVTGTLNSDGTTASASAVTFSAPIVGPVQAIDGANAIVTVLGQRVQIEGSTQYAASLGGSGLGVLPIGTELQVSGFRDSRGLWSARSLERREAGQGLVATGDAASVDATARQLTIGALIVSYSAATLEGFGGRQPANGDYVRAEGSALNSGGALQATRLALVDRRLPAQDGNSGHLQGWVTRFTSVTDFDVDGIRITTDANTKFNSQDPGGFGGLRLDRFVNVVGVLLADGRLLATNIVTNNLITINAQIFRSTPLEIAYHSDSQTCATAGTSYTVDGRNATWSSLKRGDVAILYQSFGSDFGIRCPIVIVNRLVRGPVSAIDLRRGRLTVLGQQVHTTGTTAVREVSGPRSIDALAQLAVGDVVEVAGYRNAAGVIVATRVGTPIANAPAQLAGVIANLDSTARRFTIGSQTVEYAGATAVGFPSGGVVSGQRAIVRGALGATGALVASEFEYDSPNLRGTAVGPAHIVGPITRFASLNDFDIEGRKVMPAPDNNVVIGPGPPCGEEHLQTDAFITAITASAPVPNFDNYFRVRLSHGWLGDNGTELTGRVDAVDVNARTFSIGGLEIALHGLTKMRDEAVTASCGAPLDVSALRVGDSISLSGAPGPGGQALIAANLARRTGPLANSLKLQGAITAPSATEFLLDTLRVRIGPATAINNCTGRTATAAEFELLARQLLGEGKQPTAAVDGMPSAMALTQLDAVRMDVCLPTGDRSILVRGRVDAFDANARTLSILGYTLQAAAGVSATAGQFVEISARWYPLRSAFIAESLGVQDGSGNPASILEGEADSRTRPSIQMAGRSIVTDSNTEFSDGGVIDADRFFNGNWDYYRVTVTLGSGGALRATKVEGLYYAFE